MTTIAVAGGSGFVGNGLLKALCAVEGASLVGLSRTKNSKEAGVTWRQCDLFSLKQTQTALRGANVAYFLVHSMMPHARLVQGHFRDFDVILADNFARACKKAGVEKIIYLSGIIPEGSLSPHLESRKEVETVLGSHGVPVIAVRAGLIVGKGGSSFEMMRALVQHLPVMICPKWTYSLGQPVSLRDVVQVLVQLLSRNVSKNEVWDIGGTDKLSYVDMMRIVSEELGVARRFIPFPMFTVGLSRLWVSLVTGYPKELVAPLVQSLKSNMLVGERDLMRELNITTLPFRESVQSSLGEGKKQLKNKHPSSKIHSNNNLVYSMQRLRIPKGKSVFWVAEEYGNWIGKFLWPAILVLRPQPNFLHFSVRKFFLFGPRVALLVLELDKERSDATRQLFYIRAGLLRHKLSPPSARLEFRALPMEEELISAVFDFRPALPWWIYLFTQALTHSWVMNNFSKHLLKTQ